MATLYFYHDPMCSWCWGYRPVSDRILSSLPEGVTAQKVLGGLAPDSDDPMPENLQQSLPQVWKKINALLGTEFNFDFWANCKPRRSTYPACRAVLAAGAQGHYDEMSDAIQRAYYLRAMNPSDIDTLESLAVELDLDAQQFSTDMASAEIESLLQQQIAFSRQSPIDGYPSMALDVDGALVMVRRDYKDAAVTLRHIDALLVS